MLRCNGEEIRGVQHYLSSILPSEVTSRFGNVHWSPQHLSVEPQYIYNLDFNPILEFD